MMVSNNNNDVDPDQSDADADATMTALLILAHWCLFCQYLFGIYSVKVISTEKWCLE